LKKNKKKRMPNSIRFFDEFFCKAKVKLLHSELHRSLAPPDESMFFVLDASKTRRIEHPDGSVLNVRDRRARRFNAVLRRKSRSTHNRTPFLERSCKQDKAN